MSTLSAQDVSSPLFLCEADMQGQYSMLTHPQKGKLQKSKAVILHKSENILIIRPPPLK